ncbi:zinc-binding dehydrogenase [Anaeromyxobacter oryzisoli]|uniref:zinc-binding dehydrogenase n=1 Tax=Anaeromyxobacter oryzisoli TaxID=2925408 RepID=UPI001F5888A4|nr:zinc-binding dehydrogenase [Anaeromyxobacter sp. SG63]
MAERRHVRSVRRPRPRRRPAARRAHLEGLASLVEEGKLRVHVGEALPLDDANRAHELLAREGATGKIVLTP